MTYNPSEPYWSDLVNVVNDIDDRLARLEKAVLILTDAPGSPHASADAARAALLGTE